MSTTHKLRVELKDVVRTPSRKVIQRKLKTADALDGFQMKEGYLYTVVRAISARVNQNYDGWPSDELKKAAHSFVGKPCFVNHENYDPAKARGVIIAARYVDAGRDKYVETIMEIDAKRFPKLAHEIRTGGLDSVSMGAEAGFTICSYCGNRAEDVPDMCNHVLFHKGEKLSRFNKRTGQREKVLVYESCHKLSFFELSYVFDPADETAVASKVVMAGKRHTATECPPGKDCTFHPKDEKPLSGMAGFGDPRSTAQGGGGAPATGGAPVGGGPLGQTPSTGGAPVSTGAGGPPSKDLTEALQRAGIDPAMYPLISGFSATEGNNPSGAPTLGFKDTQAGTSLDEHAQALSKQLKDRTSVAGEFPHTGSPADQASWMATVVGQNGVPSDWAGEAQPARSDYVNNIVKNMPAATPATPAVSTPATPSATSAPTQETQLAPAQKAASFENRVLKVAGFKRADKCHYCAGDAEEGRSSCAAHAKMEDNKFKAAVLREAGFLQDFLHPPTPPNRYPPAEGDHPGAGQSWSYDPTSDSYSHPSGHELRPSDEELYPGTHQLWTPTVTMSGPPGLAKDRRPHSDLQQHFDHVQRSGSFQARVIDAFRKGAPFADYKDFDDCESKNQDKGDTGAYCGEIKHRTEDKKASFESRVLAAFRTATPTDDYLEWSKKVEEGQETPEKGNVGALPAKGLHDWSERSKKRQAASSNPFNDSSGRYQGPMKTKTSFPPSPYGDGDTCPECGQHFIQGHAPGCSKASKWGTKMSFEARVLEAAGMHRMPDHPGRHEAPPGRDPHIPPEGYQVYDAKDWLNLPQPIEASFQARVIRAWGETEAPAAVDTLREEGSAPEDDNNDFYHYVEPPKELSTPDLSQAAQIDREQDVTGQDTDGAPGPMSPDAGLGGPPQPQQQYMELKIPIPQPGQAGASGAPQIPMQPYQDQPPAPAAPPAGPPPGPPQQMAASTLSYFDRYFGRRVGREMNLQTLGNGTVVTTTSRNATKGTANMARETLATRGKKVTAGRRQHFAEGPLVDSGDQSRNDEGEQEEVFITQVPPAEAVEVPKDGQEISNTENNLVAKVQRGRNQLLRDAQALANYRRKTADEAGGPVATEVNPESSTGPAGEELTGDDFESANPNEGVVETQPRDASLHAFKQFDRWLATKTGKPCRSHTSSTIRRAADDYSRAEGISVQAMFPALGIVLREARKNDKANTKGANMRKRADEKLEVAAPDGRIDVEAPVEGTTDAEAQASQFDLHDFGNNAGDNLADPDLSTDQNWAPGEANKTSKKVKTAGGILAFRCAEAMIAAGLEPNTVERKYQLAGAFENMNRGLVQSQTALCERFAAVLQNVRRKVASGSTRGAALQSPVPSGLTQGTQRTATMQRVAANDPRNDSTMFV